MGKTKREQELNELEKLAIKHKDFSIERFLVFKSSRFKGTDKRLTKQLTRIEKKRNKSLGIFTFLYQRNKQQQKGP